MEDLEMKIWSRVQGRESLSESPAMVSAMYLTERNLAQQYKKLAQEGGVQTDKLYRLFRNQQRCLSCLRGLYRLLTEGVFEDSKTEIEKKNPLPALRKCFVEEVRQRGEYEKWRNDREYGVITEALAKIKGENCALIAEIIGGM